MDVTRSRRWARRDPDPHLHGRGVRPAGL